MDEQNQEQQEAPKETPKVYFGTKRTKKFYLPETNEDQWIEVRTLDEGVRSQYQDAIAKPIRMDESQKSIEMSVGGGSDRKHLFQFAIIGYRVARQNEEGSIDYVEGQDVDKFMKELWPVMDGEIGDGVYDVIVELNSWVNRSSKESGK